MLLDSIVILINQLEDILVIIGIISGVIFIISLLLIPYLLG